MSNHVKIGDLILWRAHGEAFRIGKVIKVRHIHPQHPRAGISSEVKVNWLATIPDPGLSVLSIPKSSTVYSNYTILDEDASQNLCVLLEKHVLKKTSGLI